ncbi:MAG: START domain-containing protein [Saprospiraceae bacterium]|nr:START domain-containing protein [Saprospiraceae bacterium]
MIKLLFIIIFLFFNTNGNSIHIKNKLLIVKSHYIQNIPPWKFIKSSDGISIYTRSVDGWSVNEYRAIFTIKAPIELVEKVLRDTKNQRKWSKNTILVKEIKRVSHDIFYTYSQTNAPWPATDRDNVVHIIYTYPTKNKIHIKIESKPNAFPKNKNFVRIERMEGSWILEASSNGTTKVTQQALVDPGGSTPKWLINSFLVNGPMRNLNNLKNYIEKSINF